MHYNYLWLKKEGSFQWKDDLNGLLNCTNIIINLLIFGGKVIQSIDIAIMDFVI